MTILLVTLTVIAVSSIGLGMAMSGRKAKYQAMPVARYDRYVGSNPNHLGDN